MMADQCLETTEPKGMGSHSRSEGANAWPAATPDTALKLRKPWQVGAIVLPES